MNWKKGIIAAMILAGAMVTLTGCGDNERTKALTPYKGTWVETINYLKPGHVPAVATITMNITENKNNEETLLVMIKDSEKAAEQPHMLVYDDKDKMVKVDGTNPVMIMKDDKGEYITGPTGWYKNTKYYKQK